MTRSEKNSSEKTVDNSEVKSNESKDGGSIILEPLPQSSKNNKKRKSHNKIYRCPPSPTPQQLFMREKSFILDSLAVHNISKNFGRAQPKVGSIIPPYNSQRDVFASNYFRFYGINKVLRKNNQSSHYGTSIEGPLHDRFANAGPGYQYLSLRNREGAGHSYEVIKGHGGSLDTVKPIIGYSGNYGFRRNTPWLRAEPSSFLCRANTATILAPTHD